MKPRARRFHVGVLAQAAELAKLCPSPNGYVELRPIWEFPAS